jgi:membrane protein
VFSWLDDNIQELIWGNKLQRAGLPGRILVVVLRFLFAMMRDFFSGQLTMRAMSLVYTTLLSIVPLLAVSFAVLKGFGVFTRLEPYLHDVLAPLGAQGERITAQVLDLVDNVKGPVLGGVGLLFFLWTAISMVQKVEESFNYTWYVSKPRSFTRRFTEYLIVLLVGPLLMVTAIGLLTSIQSNTVVQWILTNPALGPLFVMLGKLIPYLMISAVFTFLYIFMPNTKVHLKSAIVGGIAGGFMWAAVAAIFTNFILFASRTQQIYAGFAVAITTLIWLYLNWLILLIGAQLAYYHQYPAFLRSGRQVPRLSNTVRERIALDTLFLVGKAFRDDGAVITVADIGQQMGIPTIAVQPILTSLEEARFLKLTEDEELVPGREMSRTPLREILDVVRGQGETGSHRKPQWTPVVDALGGRLDSAIADVVGDRTLADLLDEAEQAEKPRS